MDVITTSLSVASALPKSITFMAVDRVDNGTSVPNCNSLHEKMERNDGALRNNIKEQIKETLTL